MIRAYKMVQQFIETNDLQLTTIHPAALYGGLNTGQGFTNYIEDLRHRRFWRVPFPFVFNGRFPLVHADSLADGIVRALHQPGAFIFSDGMTSLPDLAHLANAYTGAYVPPTAPVWLARVGVVPLEWPAYLVRRPPIMARVQIEFITKDWEPVPDRAVTKLGWQPLPLPDGLRTYLEEK